jgi:hypothetical protein
MLPEPKLGVGQQVVVLQNGQQALVDETHEKPVHGGVDTERPVVPSNIMRAISFVERGNDRGLPRRWDNP